MILEAEGEEVGRGLANGQCPRVHEVRLRGDVEGEKRWLWFKISDIANNPKALQSRENSSEFGTSLIPITASTRTEVTPVPILK